MAKKVSGVQAAANMKALAESGKGGFKGWCLKTCRTALGAPAGVPSAIEAWKKIPANKKFTDPKKAPIGAPHFWEIGKFGHIAIQSEEMGKVWGTDSPVTDKVGKVDLAWFDKHWKAKYLGWSLHLNGMDLDFTQTPKTTFKAAMLGVKTTGAPAKNPVEYDAAAAAKGGGVDVAKKKAVPAKKAAAKPVAKKAAKKK